ALLLQPRVFTVRCGDGDTPLRVEVLLVRACCEVSHEGAGLRVTTARSCGLSGAEEELVAGVDREAVILPFNDHQAIPELLAKLRGKGESPFVVELRREGAKEHVL